MASVLLIAACKRDVTDAVSDARQRSALIAYHIAYDHDRISWVDYLVGPGTVAHLAHYPDTPYLTSM